MVDESRRIARWWMPVWVPQVEMGPSGPTGGATDPTGDPMGGDVSFRSYWWSYRKRWVLQILLAVPQVLQILLVVLWVEMCPSDPTGGPTGPSDPIGGPTRGDVSFRSYWWSYR